MLSHFINNEFPNYLNRYLKGILLLKHRLSNVEVTYELAEAFSNHSCRLSIDISFTDPKSLEPDEIEVANAFFYNHSSDTGIKFVSFIYKPQNEYWIDFSIIESFIIHYEFAAQVFGGFLKDILPESCKLSIEPLEDCSLFIYTRHVLWEFRDTPKHDKNLEKKYEAIVGRSFAFDCNYHQPLIEAHDKFSGTLFTKLIADTEINKSICSSEDIRRLVVNEEIPFKMHHYGSTISEIHIDATVLLDKLKSGIFLDKITGLSNQEIALLIIFLERRENEHLRQAQEHENKIADLGITIGDYIVVERDYWGRECEELGIVKKINVDNSNDINIDYVITKNDLTASKFSSKNTVASNISSSLHPSEIHAIIGNLVHEKIHAIQLLRKNGKQNSLYEPSKRKSSRLRLK